MSKLTNVKQLKAAGRDNAASQLLDSTLKQFTAWDKDWTAFQRANGVKAPTPAPPKGATG
jgi:hypothetical protein